MEETMRTLSLVVCITVAVPSLANAQTLRESAERIAANATLQQDAVGSRTSAARVSLGLAAAVAGTVMMLLEPVQPDVVSHSTLSREFEAFVDSRAFVTRVLDLETGVWYYRNISGSLNQSWQNFWNGAYDGADVAGEEMFDIASREGRLVYAGAFRERRPGLKYGGAALAVAGALMAGLWSDVPIVRQMRVAPTSGGLQVGGQIGF